VAVMALGRTRWSHNLARRRGLEAPTGSPTSYSLWIAAALGVLGVAVAIAAQNWIYLVLLGIAALIGAGRLVAFRRTGVWR
jgi:hypothetical protein